MTSVAAQPIPCEDLDLGHQVLVHISIESTNGEFALRTYPQRAEDTTIFHTRPGRLPTPVRPREVRWVVHGLASGQRILISAKTAGTGIFPQDEYTVVHPCNTVRTGPALLGPPDSVQDMRWGYNIKLQSGLDPNWSDLAFKDPVIIIIDDP